MKTNCSILAALLFVFLPTASPAETVAAKPAPSLAATLQPFLDKHDMAGAVVLVATKDKVLDVEAVGYADIKAQKPMQTDCMFLIASQSKPIAATAVMMLVDEGKLNVDDPVEKYLPEFKGQMVIAQQDAEHKLLRKPAHPMTIKNLLTHTSGLRPFSPLEEPLRDLLPLRTRVASYAMLPLEFEPGSKSLYSNAGVNTAGRIVEVVSGMPYEEFISKRLLVPLGMKDTTFWPSPEQLKRLAKPYKLNGKTGQEETTIVAFSYPLDDHRRQPIPAGGLFSTASDLSLFYRMIAQGGSFAGRRYLSEQAVAEMTRKQTGDLPSPYGFCFGVGGGRIGHAGSYGTNSSYDPKHQLITIYMVQQKGWRHKANKKILAAVQSAATKAFSTPSR